MKLLLILSIAILLTGAAVSPIAAQEKTPPQQATTPATATQTEPTKNEVELALEEAQKKGEPVLAACLENCDEDAILKGQALSLPQPPYPPLARRAHVAGVVKVHVIIDIDGKVIAAAAVEGHPLLRAVCVAAAREARFTSTLYDGKAVKVTGLIQYNFVAK